MPIDIDNTDVSDITIDGQNVSEVTADGQTVFTAIPDSAVHRWPMDEGSGTTVADAIGNADITLNGAEWDSATSTWIGGRATAYNGSGDYGVVSANRNDPGDSGSFVITLRARSISGNNFAFSHPDTNNNNRLYVFVPESGTEIAVVVGDQILTLTSNPTTDTNYRVGVKWDSGSITGYLNGAEAATGTYSGSVTFTTQDWFFGAQKPGLLFFDGYLDNPIMSTEPWTDQQFQEDYDRQPWG